MSLKRGHIAKQKHVLKHVILFNDEDKLLPRCYAYKYGNWQKLQITFEIHSKVYVETNMVLDSSILTDR